MGRIVSVYEIAFRSNKESFEENTALTLTFLLFMILTEQLITENLQNFCKLDVKGLKMNLQITHVNVKPLQLKRLLAKFSGFRNGSNFWQFIQRRVTLQAKEGVELM